MSSIYSTSAPHIVDAFIGAYAVINQYARDVAKATRQLGRNKGPCRGGGMHGPLTVDGLIPDDPTNPPEGWVYIKTRGRLEPARGKRGEPARQWMRDHTPPRVDARIILATHGLPRYSFDGVRDASRIYSAPAVFLHNHILWARYRGEPTTEWLTTEPIFTEPGPEWVLRRRSECPPAICTALAEWRAL